MTHPLIEKRFVDTRKGRIAYLQAGDPSLPPVLFVHGIPTSSYLWRHVIRFLRNDFCCYAPDLMGLGDTEVDPTTGRFDMDAQAEMLGEFMTAMGHETFGLVCHDQGGAAAQILAVRENHRIRCFALTDCVCYDNWPVPVVVAYQRLLRLPGADRLMNRSLIGWFEGRSRWSSFKRGVHDTNAFTEEAAREYLRPLLGSKVGRERFRQFILAGHPRYTELVVPALREMKTPSLVLWAADDHYLSPSWGRQLFEDIPGADSFQLIPFCGHFWQEERPAEFSAHSGRFLAKHMAAASAVSEEPANDDAKPACKPRKGSRPRRVAKAS